MERRVELLEWWLWDFWKDGWERQIDCPGLGLHYCDSFITEEVIWLTSDLLPIFSSSGSSSGHVMSKIWCPQKMLWAITSGISGQIILKHLSHPHSVLLPALNGRPQSKRAKSRCDWVTSLSSLLTVEHWMAPTPVFCLRPHSGCGETQCRHLTDFSSSSSILASPLHAGWLRSILPIISLARIAPNDLSSSSI